MRLFFAAEFDPFVDKRRLRRRSRGRGSRPAVAVGGPGRTSCDAQVSWGHSGGNCPGARGVVTVRAQGSHRSTSSSGGWAVSRSQEAPRAFLRGDDRRARAESSSPGRSRPPFTTGYRYPRRPAPSRRTPRSRGSDSDLPDLAARLEKAPPVERGSQRLERVTLMESELHREGSDVPSGQRVALSELNDSIPGELQRSDTYPLQSLRWDAIVWGRVTLNRGCLHRLWVGCGDVIRKREKT